MSSFNPAYFYESGKNRINTYIGGIGASASTKELLATRLGISSTRISNFGIIDNNVQCRISGSYSLPSTSFSYDTNVTYYLDKAGLISNLSAQHQFRGAINFNGELIMNGASALIEPYSNRFGYLNRVICKNATSLVGAAFYNGDVPYLRQTFYFPNVINMGENALSNSVFYGIQRNSYIYAHPSMATNNSGGPDGDLAYATTTAGAIVRYVTDFTLPNPISDLSVGAINSTSVELLFTEPYATNIIDYYDVYINGTYNCSCKPGQVYAQGLNPNTAYEIVAYAVDMLFNRSISNAVYATTSSTLGFVSTWDTTKTSTGSSTSTQIRLPLIEQGAYKFSVDWGDGSSSTITAWNDAATTHTYSTTGVYTITITGKCRGWVFGNSGDKLKILSVSSWGTLNLGSVQPNQGSHFYGCANLNLSTVSDQLCLHRVYTLENSFTNCVSITSINNINTWVMGNIESLSNTFYGNTLLNQELNLFTKYVNDMTLTFALCSSFNNGLPSGNPGTMSWDTSSVTSMARTFTNATSFNCNVGSWNVSSVSNFYGMFSGASKFNNGGSSSIGSWQTTSATNMYQMFYAATLFNQPLNGWNTQNVTTMFWMFASATAFNQSLSAWNTQSVTTMERMFASATSFNNGLSSGATGSLAWNTSAVTTTQNMFDQATSFNCNVGSWDVSKVTTFYYMFSGASKFNNGGSADINNWTLKTTGPVDMYGMFIYAVVFNQSLSSWNTSAVTNMALTFANTNIFNQDLSSWDTAAVTTMQSMFSGASAFNNGLSSGTAGTLAWNTGNVTNMSAMFYVASSFNCNIGSWDVSKVTTFQQTFLNAAKFNNGESDTIGTAWQLNIIGFVNMSGMFQGAIKFNQPLSAWNTQNVTNMSAMFYGASIFNNGSASGIAGTLAWNTGNVTDMYGMFYNDVAFNCNIGSWNVSKVTTFYYMFNTASKFNNGGSADISNWVLKSTGTVDMYGMFYNAVAFNQPLNTNGIYWDTSRVTNMGIAFYGAVIFNQDLSLWNTQEVTSMGGMFGSAVAFNNGLPSGDAGTLAWNTGNMTNVSGIFYGATSFNCNIGSWDVSKVANFSQTFMNAVKFNNGESASIGTWTLNTATNFSMVSMFSGAVKFNQPLNGWNTTKVNNMSYMFYSATIFNQPLNGWNTSSVTNMGQMFYVATAFDQDIGSWDVSVVTDFTNFMSTKTPSTFSTTNLDAIYNGWSTRPVLPSKSISFGNAKRTAASDAGRAILIGSPNFWTIFDGGI